MFVDCNNRKTRSANIRRMAELEPSLFDLANALGIKLHWRDGVMWGNDVQLTFQKRKLENGDVVDLDEKGRAAAAMELLGVIAKARVEWPSLLDRANRIIDGFITQVVAPKSLRPMSFSVYQDNSLDSCWTFGGSRLGAQDEAEVGLHLIGEDEIRGYGETLADAVVDLRAKAEAKFKGRQPSGIATKPFDGDSELSEVMRAIGVGGKGP